MIKLNKSNKTTILFMMSAISLVGAFLILPNITLAGYHIESKLTASDLEAYDRFGSDLSISGDVVVVGVHLDDDHGNSSGSAYVFRYNGSTWAEEAKLTASDAAAGDEFGRSVSINGDVIVAGSDWDDDDGNNSGSAYVFRYDGITWVEEAKLTASDAAAGDNFGATTSISSNLILVGANGNDDDGEMSGSAYVFRYNESTWVEEAKLTASDATAGDRFGAEISISGNVILVGAFDDDHAGYRSGSAYVFRYNGSTWVEEAKLTASDAAPAHHFGYGLSISGDVAVVGAEGDDDMGTDSGSAYVFRYNGSTWVEETKLYSSDAAAGDGFASHNVSMSGDKVLIGATGNDDDGDRSGSAYVFLYDGSTWVEEAKLTAGDAEAGDMFGYKTTIFANVAVVSAYHDYDPIAGPEAGSVYVFQLSEKNPANGHWYQRYDNSMTWHDAKAHCENLGGYLATLNSQEEHDFVFDNLGVGAPYGMAWLGATDEVQEGVWHWVTGEPWDFIYWDDGEPLNCAGIEHYLTFFTPNAPPARVGFWNDLGSGNDGGCGCLGCIDSWYPVSTICEWDALSTAKQIACLADNWYARAEDGGNENGDDIRRRPVNDNLAKWELIPDGGDYRIKLSGTDFYFSAEGPEGSIPNGRNVHLWEWADSDLQRWELIPDGAYYRLRCAEDDIYLSGSGEDDNIHLWGWVGSDLQRWDIQDFTPEACEGDFDGNGAVDESDFSLFVNDFGRADCSGTIDCPGDFNTDNDVDGKNLATFTADFGRTDCP